jgi:hypothetical protein
MRRLLFLVVAIMLGGCGLLGCETSVLATKQNPKGPQFAVTFTRNCGDSTGFTTHVSLLTTDSVGYRSVGNVSSPPVARLARLAWKSSGARRGSLWSTIRRAFQQ